MMSLVQLELHAMQCLCLETNRIVFTVNKGFELELCFLSQFIFIREVFDTSDCHQYVCDFDGNILFSSYVLVGV